jgi:hypothetical protein
MAQSLLESLVQGGLMLIGSVGTCAVAMVLAKSLRTRWPRPVIDSVLVDRTIDGLVRVADLANASGIAAAAEQLNSDQYPLLQQGLRFAIDGARSTQVHEKLISLADHRTLRLVQARYRRTLIMGSTVVLGIVLLTLWTMLVGTSPNGGTGRPAWVLIGSVMATLAAIPALSWAVLRIDCVPMASGLEELTAAFEIDAATLIVAGATPSDIRAHLLSMVPPSQRNVAAVSISRVA